MHAPQDDEGGRHVLIDAEHVERLWPRSERHWQDMVEWPMGAELHHDRQTQRTASARRAPQLSSSQVSLESMD